MQLLIKEIQRKYKIIDDNVVLYGFSRGGTGAIYHAALGNFKAVSVEPLIDITQLYQNFWDKGEDRLLLKEQLSLDLSTYILNALENYNRPKEDLVVLTSKNSPAFENSILILQASGKITKKDVTANFSKLRISDLTITHGAFIGRTKKIAHSEIIQLLYNDIISINYDTPDFYFKDWFALPDSFQFPENVRYYWSSHYFSAIRDNDKNDITGFDFVGLQVIKDCIIPENVVEIETIGEYQGKIFFYNFTKPFNFNWNDMISYVDKELVELKLLRINQDTNIYTYQIINSTEKSFYFIGFDTDFLKLHKVVRVL